MGTVGGGAAVVTGTGAFTSVTADRTVNVEVAGDASALLAIEGTGEHSDYIDNSDGNGEFGIDLSGGSASGVNADAITVVEDLFKVTNQGTQEVNLDVTPLAFVDTSGPNVLGVLVVPSTGFPSVDIPTGESEIYSLVVAEFSPTGADLSVDDGTINFFAEAI